MIASVTTSKTIFSITYNMSYTKYVAMGQDATEWHATLTTAEPTQIAVREAIETALCQLIEQSIPAGLWSRGPPEVLPAELMAGAFRESIKTQPHPKRDPGARPAELPPAGNRQQAAGPGLRLSTNVSTREVALVTPAVEGDLMSGAVPALRSGTFH